MFGLRFFSLPSAVLGDEHLWPCWCVLNTKFKYTLLSFLNIVKSDDDRYVQLGEESARVTSETINYLYLDFFPWSE